MKKYKLDLEGSIRGGQKVKYKGKEYTTGNRYADTVELWDGSRFLQVVRVLVNHTFRTLGTTHQSRP